MIAQLKASVALAVLSWCSTVVIIADGVTSGTKNAGEAWFGFFAEDYYDTGGKTHWQIQFQVAEALLLSSPKTIAVFYMCGANAEPKMAAFRKDLEEKAPGVGQRARRSEEYCDALAGDSPMVCWWRMTGGATGKCGGFMSERFEAIVREEASKLDALFWDKVYSAWAKVGVAKNMELPPAVFNNVGNGSLFPDSIKDFSTTCDSYCSSTG